MVNKLIVNRLNKLRESLKEANLEAYYIPTSDYHCSEYVDDYFKDRYYLSNFSGSSGELIVTLDNAYLFTDGRYFIQAEAELRGTSIQLMKKGQNGVPTPVQLLKKLKIKRLGFDGKKTPYNEGKQFENNFRISYDTNLVSRDDNPIFPCTEVFPLELKYAGESSFGKLKRIRKQMKEDKVDNYLLCSLDDIAWCLNLRGRDIPCTPVNMAYVIITLTDILIFIDNKKLSAEVIQSFRQIQPTYYEYNDIYEYVLKLKNQKFVVDDSKTNYLLLRNIEKHNFVLHKESYITLMKAIKNDIEVKNIKKAHVIDGVAMVKFMKFLKDHEGKITEISATKYLYELRSQAPSYIEPSFNTIAAYNEHGAMMHYCADWQSDCNLGYDGFFLVDSGGQYLEGTTDITRTFVMGELTDEQRKHYTLVLKSSLRLMMAKFLYGCRGVNLDILARGPIWDEMLDYQCGTGHGVGYLSNVHEAPNGFRWKIVPERNDSCVLEKNMITTDEPGIYLKDQYGIRIENELLTVELCENEYGKFMGFENVTVCPIDIDAIDKKYLTKEEIKYLNDYHKFVYKKLNRFLNDEEKAFLKQYTRKI